SIFVRFNLEGVEATSFLAWTTTPWTLPSNVALCMNAKENYSKIKFGDEYLILATNLISSLFDDGSYEIIDTKKGNEYEGVRYIPLFDYVSDTSKGWYVTNDSYVTLTDGTGIVHIAPAFGEDDANVGRKYNLPFVKLVNDRGLLTDEVYDFKGLFVKDADKLIIKKLAERGLIFKEMMYEHSYPFCWRCDTPLLYYARESWFIKMSAVKEQLLKNNYSVNWMPSTIAKGRMGNFLENVIDWGISRERYWGTPLPIWVCDKCGKVHIIGSKEELRTLGKLDHDIELHKPYIDAVTFDCECGGTMRRTPEVIDCWYDSGSMPFAQWHYPFENKEIFDKVFPANFISEAVDQTRGWFYTLLAISTLLFDKSPFENCIVLGHVNDKDGQKMSKHKGNVVDPFTVLDKQGADAVRWYFYTASSPWLPSRFYEEAVSEAQRKFMGTLWNTYAFFVLYAEIDKFDPTQYNLSKCSLSVMDKWILSELNSLIKFVDESLNEYKIFESSRKIQDFVDELSNWYVRRCRERYWGSKMTDDKAAAYMTLYTVLTELSKLIAPYTPFMAENIYQNLVCGFYKDAPESVHLAEFPTSNSNYISSELENGMQAVMQAVVLGRAARNKANIKNRQPLQTMYIKGFNLSDEWKVLVEDELNVKEVAVTSGEDEFVTYELKPQLKTIGPKYGKLLNKIKEFLANANGSEIVKAIENGVYSVILDGVLVEFAKDDILVSVKNREGFSSEVEGEFAVILDTNLSDALIDEGIEREIVSKIQTMRKEADFEVVDHIVVGYKAEGLCAKVIRGNKNILSDVLATDIVEVIDGYTKEWNINGEDLTLSVKRI
ncbi:MAG: isoleucine--tRNA ligase, partial [Clostridia bacterium]